jgi:hypothetical protein
MESDSGRFLIKADKKMLLLECRERKRERSGGEEARRRTAR